MEPTRLPHLLAPALTTVLIVVAACGPATPASPTTTATSLSATSAPAAPPTVAPTAVASTAEFDRVFIDMMVPHHEAALEMARVAQQRSEHPELKQLADQILSSQDAEIGKMRSWRQAWFGSRETPPMSRMPMLMSGMTDGSHTMDMGADVQQLRDAPDPFDLAFMNAMIVHHQSAVDAGRVALLQAQRGEIKDLAGDIIDAQLREIGQMQTWRLSWYGGSTYVPPQNVTPSQAPMKMVPGEDMNH